MDERNRRIRELFDRALELAGDTRDEVLRRECGDDQELRRVVESLLGHADRHSTTHLPHAVGLGPQSVTDQPGSLPDWMVAGTTIGPYELIRELGRGGMGVVFVVRHCRLGPLRAIKFLQGRRAQTPEAVDRFVAEGRAHAMCQHENIVVIHDVGTHEGCPFMVLEYLEGQTLREWMRDVATRAAAAFAQTLEPDDDAPSDVSANAAPSFALPVGRVVEVMVSVVRALVHAHDQGIVHRDLKPENVMLTEAGTVKVLDFGIATLVSAGDAGSGGPIAGTPPYMAPEQLTGDRIDRRADIWAIGVMLYELVAGRRPLAPFTPASISEVADMDVPMPSAAEQMPGLGPLGPIIDRCLLKPVEARTPTAQALLAELEPLLPVARRRERAEGESPFPGLSAFQESDADRFYGRDKDIARLVAHVRRKPLVAIAGPSGAGKSSLVRAGIIPALKRSGEGWDTFTIRPGRRPLASLAQVIARLSSVAGEQPGSSGDAHQIVARHALEERLGREPGYFGTRLRAHASKRLRQVVVFIDQFEELYTLCDDDTERAAFVACIESAADDPASPVRVISTIRADFLDRVVADPMLAPVLSPNLQALTPVEREGLRDALVKPLIAAGYQFESDDLVDTMLDALVPTAAESEDDPTGSARDEHKSGAPRSVLPLLQFTAARLWDERDVKRRQLTRDSYDRIGGVEGALATHADVVLAGMPQADMALARAILERLVTPERTRQVVSVSELSELDEPRNVDRVLTNLADARLVTVEAKTGEGESGDDDRKQHTVELVHESLIDRWPRLRRWLHENKEDRAFRAQLRAAARQWEESGRSNDLLWRGQAARNALRWYRRRSQSGHVEPHEALGERDESYLRAIVTLETRARRRRRRAITAAFGVLAAFGLVVSYLAVRANAEATRADRGQKRAQEEAARADREAAQAREEAVRARNVSRMVAARELRDDPTAALSVLREVEPSHVPDGWSAWTRRAFNEGVARHVLVHPTRAFTVMFSPNGKQVVTAAADAFVRIWKADGSGEPVIIGSHPGLDLAAFSPDGSRIVTPSYDGTARVWRADGSGDPVILRGHEDIVHFAWFSPDGRRVITTSYDKTARIWNADGTGEPIILRGHADWVSGAQFIAGGERILTVSADRSMRLWNADGTGAVAVIKTHQPLLWAMFSHDETDIVSCGGESEFRIWNADGSGEPTVVRSPGPVNFIAYSADGEHLVSTGPDGAVRVWNTADYRQTAIFPYANPTVAQFSPDGARILSASWDNTARIWNVRDTRRPVVLYGHDAAVNSVAFDAEGARVVTASDDETARVWNSDGSGRTTALAGRRSKLRSAVFSPDGARVAAAYLDGVVELRRVSDGALVGVLRGHTDDVLSVAFSPDGSRIVTGSSDYTARVWNADGSVHAELRGHLAEVFSAAFSPDGTRVVTASWDDTARIWRADGTGEPIVLRGHTGPVNAAAFSPDGTRVVTASSDKTVRIWNADGSGEPLVLRGHAAEVRSAAFSPDGTRIASGSMDKTVRIWTADGSGEPVVLLGHDGPVHSVAFGPDGTRVASGSADGTARIWRDLEPLQPGDPRLWTATDYCLPIDQRRRLLNVSEETARADFASCQRRVRAAP